MKDLIAIKQKTEQVKKSYCPLSPETSHLPIL